MARIRTIKPDFWTSEKVVNCLPMARLMFIGIWNFCDDNGVFAGGAKALKMRVLPGDDLTTTEIDELKQQLIDSGLLREYSVNGKNYIIVVGWAKHQKINKPQDSSNPTPEELEKLSKKIPQQKQDITTNSVNAPGTLPECSGNATGRKGKESIGKDSNTTASASPDAMCDLDDQIDKLFQIYPNRAGGNPKARALKALNARLREGISYDQIIEGVIRYARFIKAEDKQDTQYVMQAATFLGPDKQFLDEWTIPARKNNSWADQQIAVAKALTPTLYQTQPQNNDNSRVFENDWC